MSRHTLLYVVSAVALLSCGESRPKTDELAQAKLDLAITRQDWKPASQKAKKGFKLDQGPTFTISNQSHTVTYRRIELNVFFFDAEGHKIDSTSKQVDKPIGPGKNQLVRYIRMDSINPAAKTAQAFLKAAAH